MEVVTAVSKVLKKGILKVENLEFYVVVEKVEWWSDTMDEKQVATLVLLWAVKRVDEVVILSVDTMVVQKVLLLVETMAAT